MQYGLTLNFPNRSIDQEAGMSRKVRQAMSFACGVALAPGVVFAAPQETTTAIKRESDAAIGKLFTNSGTCSASVISGKNIIVTAAHCCWNRATRNWIGGWSFAPAYNTGNAPYGIFIWSQARVLNSWINNGDVASDVCLIALQNDAAGRGGPWLRDYRTGNHVDSVVHAQGC
jgi:hypothetical protein